MFLHLQGLLFSVAHPHLHFQFCIDPRMIREEHQVSQGKIPVHHAEVHVVMHSSMRVMNRLMSNWLQKIGIGLEVFVEEGEPELIMRQHLVVCHLGMDRLIGLSLPIYLQILQVVDFFIFTEPATVVEHYLPLFLIVQIHSLTIFHEFLVILIAGHSQ